MISGGFGLTQGQASRGRQPRTIRSRESQESWHLDDFGRCGYLYPQSAGSVYCNI